jgi:hypothetical protein
MSRALGDKVRVYAFSLTPGIFQLDSLSSWGRRGRRQRKGAFAYNTMILIINGEEMVTMCAKVQAITLCIGARDCLRLDINKENTVTLIQYTGMMFY